MILKRLINLCLAFGLICSTCYGDELTDLSVKLQKLDGKDAIQAEVNIKVETIEQKSKKSQQLESAYMILADSNALTFKYTGDISKLTSVAAAQNASFGSQSAETAILQELTLQRAAELVNYGSILSKNLENMKLFKKQADKYQEISCTLLHLKNEQKQSVSGMNATVSQNFKIWLDSDGYPVAGTFETSVTAKMLLVFKFTSETLRQQEYKRIGDRLFLSLDKNQTNIKTDDGDTKRIVTTTLKIQND